MQENESWIERMKRYNSKKDIIKFFLLFPPICLLLILILLSYIFQWEWPDWTGFVAGYVAFGGLFIGSIIGYIASRIKCREAVGKDAIVVTGTIIAHFTNNERRRYDRLYYPVYEYVVNGQKCELVSNIATKKRGRNVGTQVKIFYNPNTGEAFCVSDMRMQGRLYLIFAAVGALAVALITNTLLRFY